MTSTHKPCKSTLSTLAVVLAVCSVLTTHAANLQWDAAPATPGIQDGAGNWSNAGTLTNWWDGTQNVPWAPGSVASIGFTNLTAATITLTNPIAAGGVVFSNVSAYAGTGGGPAYTFSGSNLTVTGSPASIIEGSTYPLAGVGASAGEVFNVSVIATNGLALVGTSPWQSQLTFQNASNGITGTLEIGTPGNASYTTPTALQVQFNTTGIGANALTNCTNIIVHSNASWFCRGGSAGFTLNWPKNFIISGDGCVNSSFNFGAIMFGSAGANSVITANVQLAGDSTIIGAWGNASATIWSNTISGTGRLRFASSANRPTTGNVIFKGKHTYVGNTIIDGTMAVTLASGTNDRLPTATILGLGTTGAFQAPNSANVPQSAWNGYGRLVLGDSAGAMNQTLAGLTNDPAVIGPTGCWVIGGNGSAISVLTINNTTNCTYNARLGGPTSPDNHIGLVKSGTGTLNLQGTNQCLGGYTINGGTLAFGDGVSDTALSGPITNNSALIINVAGGLTYGEVISGTGSLTKGAFGLLTLTATNTYMGPTVVTTGKLVVNNTMTGNGSISVASGAELQINRATASNSLTAASFSIDSATLDVDVDFNSSGPAATPAMNIVGGLTNNGSTTVNILHPGVLTVGSYPLIKYGTYQSNAFSSLNLTSLPGATASLQNNPANQSIDLVITAVAGQQVQWTGATDGNWDTSTTNWLDASLAPTIYATSDFVLFNDSATGPTAIQISSDPQPSSITVSNVSKAYSFNGAGLTSTGPLIKQGGGTLTVAINDSSAAGTQIQGGTIQVGDGTTDGSITSPILDNGSLVFNVISTATDSDISGTGSVIKTGPGQLTLGGNSSYLGATTVQQGTLYVQSSTALGATNGATTVSPGAELWLDATAMNIPEQIIIGGMGIGGVEAALNASANAVSSTISGNITLTTNTQMITATGTTTVLSGLVNGGTNTLLIQPNGSGAVNITSNFVASSLVVNGAGSVRLMGSNNLNTIALPNLGGLVGFNSFAFGTNCQIGITNSLVPGTASATVVIASNSSIPASVVLTSSASAGAASAFRNQLSFGAAPSETNIWNGPITVLGPDPFSSGLPGYLAIFCNNGRAIINGNITVPSNQTANIQVRGLGTAGGVLNGTINLDTNSFTRTDTALWTIASTGNTWAQTLIFTGPLQIGTNEALPANAGLGLYVAASSLDLNGFTQHVASLTNGGTATWGSVINNSSNNAATLIYQGGGSLFGGSINATVGARPLNLDVAGGSLTLSGTNTYSGNSTVRSGATLALSGNGNASSTHLIDVQAGGTFDLTGSTSPVLASGQVLEGNGTVLGNLTAAGTIAPGESIGTLTVTGDLLLTNSATTIIEVNQAAATNDLLVVNGTVTYGGTLVIPNTSATPYSVNQVIKLFQAATYGGGFASIVFPGATTYDASNLTVDGTIKVLSLVSTTPTTITNTVAGGALTLSWPADHKGWRLQVQTNNLNQGVSRNSADWGTVAGSQSTNSVTIPINGATADEFYRLTYP